MGGPPSFPLPAGEAIGDGTPDVCGDKSCKQHHSDTSVHVQTLLRSCTSFPRWQESKEPKKGYTIPFRKFCLSGARPSQGHCLCLQTDRQTDRQTDGQTDTQTGRQAALPRAMQSTGAECYVTHSNADRSRPYSPKTIDLPQIAAERENLASICDTQKQNDENHHNSTA